MAGAFFDLDKTVIAKASIAAFGPPLRKGGLINRRTVVRALIGQLIYLQFGADERRLAKIRESLLEITKGWEKARVREIVRETLMETIEPLIYDEAIKLMEDHHAAGDRVYLVSASPEEIVEPLAELLGVDGAIASIGETDATGRYTGKMAFYAYGEHKAEAMTELALREGFALADSFAYSDSATDLPMLEAVGHPVAVNPDRPLGRIARERTWEICQFTKPVRLRGRVPVRLPVVTGSVAVAMGTVVLLVWRIHRSRARGNTPRGTLVGARGES